MDSFVAIDFETCQKRRASPIQLGVVRVIDGRIGMPFTEPVKPPEGYRRFDPELTRIHGLSPDYIRNAPEWPSILARLDRFTIGPDGNRLPLVVHNAVFKRSVIDKTTAEYDVAPIRFRYFCTLKLARAVDRHSPNHKLNTLAKRYSLEQLRHHDAGDDAVVGARLMMHLLQLPGGRAAAGASVLR